MLTVGELAAAAGVSTRTVRHYHAIGLMPPAQRRGNGYREYPVGALVRLVRIRRLVDTGLPLPRVRALLDACPDTTVRAELEQLAGELEQQETALRVQREKVLALLAQQGEDPTEQRLAATLAALDAHPLSSAHPDLARVESEAVRLVYATTSSEQFAEFAAQYERNLAAAAVQAQAPELTTFLASLADSEPTSQQWQHMVAAFAAFITQTGLTAPIDANEASPAQHEPLVAALLGSLHPRQQQFLTEVSATFNSAERNPL